LVQVLLAHWFVAPALRSRGEFWWVIITSTGGFLCGLILLFPGAPRYGSIRTSFHDICDLKGCAAETPFVLASSLIAMATGAPLGPELAVSTMGSCLAAVLASCLNVDRRTEAGLVQTGLAGSLGGLLLSPILGVTLAHELSVTGRRSDLLLDTLTCSEIGIPRDVVAHRDHDFMEQVTLGGTAATGAYIISRLLLNHASSEWGRVMDLGEDVFEIWHLAAAVPIGLVCGVTGILAIGLIGIFQSIRVSSCRILDEKLKFPPWIGIVVLPTVGGFVHGLLSVWNPALVGSGMRVVFDVLRDDAVATHVPWLVASAGGKLASMSICIGFGLVGGPIFPMIFVGLCLGMAMTPLVPVSLAVPCCMCATVGSFVPIPFTLVFYIAFSMTLSVNQIGPVFVANFVAFTFVGGLGIIKRLGERRLGYVAPEVDLSHWEQTQGPGGEDEDIFQYEAVDEGLDDDENELVQEVRNAVFGDTNPMW
jgi:H+/Cl- antiporter ClcA